MIDHTQVRLGRKAIKRDTRTLQLRDYVAPAALPTPPKSVSYLGQNVVWGDMCNSNLGCCTIAGVGHHSQAWTLNAQGKPIDVPDSLILSTYSKWDGYVAGDASTDNGGIELDVLNDWKRDGFGGVDLTGFVAVDFTDPDMVNTALWLFGGLYIGVNLPISAQNQQLWDVTTGHDARPGTWGGHCVYVGARDGVYSRRTCITWGTEQVMSDAFWNKYVDECYALLSPAWIMPTGTAPSGFAMPQLLTDLACIR